MDLPKWQKTTEQVTEADLESQCNGTSKSASDLIPGIQNEITLGPIMDHLTWYERPSLATLNRAWREVLLNVHPNFIIVYTYSTRWVLSPVNSALRIFQDGILRSLPLPDIPSIDLGFARFLATDRQIFSLVPSKNMYKVNVHDLGGGMIGWQSLPLLPNMGRFVFITSNSADGDNKKSRQIYIWMCNVDEYTNSEEFCFANDWESICSAEENKWSVWRLQMGNDNHTLEWQWESLPPPLQSPKNAGSRPSQYLDICSGKFRHLYKRRVICEYSFKELDRLTSWMMRHDMDGPMPFFLVLKDDYERCEGGAIAGIHFILPKGSADGGTFKVYIYHMQLENVEAIHGEELSSFQSFWSPDISPSRTASNEQMSAVKFVADIYLGSNKSTQGKLQFSLPSGEGDELILNKWSAISLAQGQTMYGYHLVASNRCP